MSKQFIFIIEQDDLAAFSKLFPFFKAIEVMGLPLKADDGTEYMALVIPRPVEPEAVPSKVEPITEVESDGQG